MKNGKRLVFETQLSSADIFNPQTQKIRWAYQSQDLQARRAKAEASLA